MHKLEIFYYSNCGKSVCFETQMFLERKGHRSSLLIKISLSSLYNLAKWDRASRNWLKNLDRRWCVEGIAITISSDNDREAGQASEKKSKRRERERIYKAGGLANVRMLSSTMFPPPLRVQKVSTPTLSTLFSSFKSSQLSTAPPRGARSRPEVDAHTAVCSMSRTAVPPRNRFPSFLSLSLSLSSVLFFVHCTRARRVSRVRVSIGFRGSRNVSRVACTFERGIRTEKSDSERLTGAICCVSCLYSVFYSWDYHLDFFLIICRENLSLDGSF